MTDLQNELIDNLRTAMKKPYGAGSTIVMSKTDFDFIKGLAVEQIVDDEASAATYWGMEIVSSDHMPAGNFAVVAAPPDFLATAMMPMTPEPPSYSGMFISPLLDAKIVCPPVLAIGLTDYVSRKERRTFVKYLHRLALMLPPRLRRLKNADNDFYKRFLARQKKRVSKKLRWKNGRRKQ